MSRSKVVLSTSALCAILRRERRTKKVVFTNGCFDLIHLGHLKVFEMCKKKGDVLVVGLNSDASVRRIKGPKRPLIPFKDRSALLVGLRPVDYVTIFHEDTPENLIRLIRPDVLVKGGDWKASKIVGRNIAKKVVRVPLLKGRSTTHLINLIVKRYASKKKTKRNH